MKKKTLISSILVIALCLCLIVGSTFALFTSSDDVTVAVDAGKVEIDAGLSNLALFSVQPDPNGEEFDEYGKTYTYQPQKDKFLNEGTATLDEKNGIINLVNITPGDKVTFNLNSVNDSDVAVQYRYKIECVEGYKLMSGMIVTVNGVKYPAMAAYTSGWNPLAVNEEMTDVKLALELPVSAGNDFKEENAKVKMTVEVVQANADVSDTDYPDDEPFVQYITSVDNATELAAKIAADEYLHIFVSEDIPETVVVNESITNKTIDANGNSVHLSFEKTAAGESIWLENVVVKNLNTKTINIATGVNGDISIIDSEFTSDEKLGAGAYNAFVAGRGAAEDELDVTVEGCTFDGQGVVSNAVYFMNVHNLTIRDCKVKNTSSWAVMNANGSCSGNVVVSDCSFENCVGILKAGVKGGTGSGTLSGNFTFANNKMVNCNLKNELYMDVTLEGKLTFSNNTMNDVVVTPEDMLGIKSK